MWVKLILDGTCLLDYNLALNMYEPGWAEKPEDFEGWVSLDGRKCREKDWRKFFESMCTVAKFEVDYECFNDTFVSIWSSIVTVHIFLIIIIWQHRIMQIKHFGLRRVYFECAKFAFGGKIEKMRLNN